MPSYVVAGCSTYSKALFLNHEGYPQGLSSAHGSIVRDDSRKLYTDWWSCLGAISLGYGHVAVNDAIRAQLHEGICFSLPHHIEEETAELLCGMAGVEQLRWCNNGSDAPEAAVEPVA